MQADSLPSESPGKPKTSHGYDQILNQFPLKFDLLDPKTIFQALENAENVKGQDIERNGGSHDLSYPVKEGCPQTLRPSNKMTNGGQNCGSLNILPYCFLNIASLKTFNKGQKQVLKNLNDSFGNHFKCIESCENVPQRILSPSLSLSELFESKLQSQNPITPKHSSVCFWIQPFCGLNSVPSLRMWSYFEID